MRGQGRIFLRGTTHWIAFSLKGQEVRESVAKALHLPAAQITQADALRLLHQRLGDAAHGTLQRADQTRLLVREMFDAYLASRRLKGTKPKVLASIICDLARVNADFGAMRALDVTPRAIEAWTTTALASGLARGTVRLSLAYFRAALHYAHRSQLLPVVPHVPMISVQNTRTGFFEREDFERVVALLEPAVADAMTFAYLTGWRKDEILSLAWADVDRAGQQIRLAESKTGAGNVLPLIGELAELVERRWHARALGVPYVFHRRHRRTKQTGRIGNFYGQWHGACRRAGVPGRLPHDLRRTVARDLVAAGNDYKSAMAVTHHASPAVFMRYRIVDVTDKRRAMTAMEAHRGRTA